MNHERINALFQAAGTNVILRYRYVFLALVLAACVAGVQGMGRLRFDSSNESFFPENDDLVLMNDRFKEVFGNEEFLFILVEAEDVFSRETLGYIRSLTEDLRANLPFVNDVVSLTDAEFIEADENTLRVEDLVGEEIPEGADALDAIRRRALSRPLYRDRILSADGGTTGILVGLERIPPAVRVPASGSFSPLDQAGWSPEEVFLADRIFPADHDPGEPAGRELCTVSDPRKLIAPALGTILGRHRTEGIRVTATGMPVLDFEIDRVTDREGRRFGVVALVVSVALMLALFRCVTGVVGPFLVVGCTLVILYGLMGWLGYPVTLMSTVVSTLILVISVSYSIHVIHHLLARFRSTGSRREALRHAYFHAGWPCFVTAVTTSVGFGSFLLVPIKPIRELGVLCSTGVFLTYLLVMILVPVVFSFGRDREPDGREEEGKSAAGYLVRLADAVTRRSVAVCLGSLAVVAVLFHFTFGVRVESDFLAILGEKVPFVRDCERIVDRLGGLYSYEVLIELPAEGMAKDPKVLGAVDELGRMIRGWPSTVVTTSAADLISDIHLAMDGGSEAHHRLPDTRGLVAQYLLLYEMSGGETLSDWMDDGRRRLRISVQVKASSTTLTRRFEEIRALGRSLFPPGTQILIAGEVPLMMRMVNMLSVGQVRSVLAAFGVITLMMILVLGSVRVGLLSMVPNTLPVLMVGGIMGMAGIPLDMVTVMVMPMIIDIAVDDTVHYILHFQQEVRACGNYGEANRRTFRRVGRAILFTSVILAAGFLIFGLSDMASMGAMAVLSCAGILSALAADLVVTPALFVFLKPFGRAGATR